MKTKRKSLFAKNAKKVVKKAKASPKVSVKVTTKTKIKKFTSAQIEQLILDHRVKARKLSRSMLRRWRARLDIQELDSLVDLSLCEAAFRFNPGKGASFMTFLYYHMHGYLVRAVEENCNINAVPANSFEINELPSDYNVITFKNGIHKMTTASDVADALSNTDYLLPDEICYKNELLDLSNQACSKLTDLQRDIVDNLFNDEKSVVDIAKKLGYSRCHISRVKRKTFEELFDSLKPHVENAPNSKPIFDENEVNVVKSKNIRNKKRFPLAGLKASKKDFERAVA